MINTWFWEASNGRHHRVMVRFGWGEKREHHIQYRMADGIRGWFQWVS